MRLLIQTSVFLIAVAFACACSDKSNTPGNNGSCDDCDFGIDVDIDFSEDASIDMDTDTPSPSILETLSWISPVGRLDSFVVLHAYRELPIGGLFAVPFVASSVQQEGVETYEFARLLEYENEIDPQKNGSVIRPVIWSTNEVLVYFDHPQRLVSFTAPDFKITGELALQGGVFGIYTYGTRVVIMGEANIWILEKTPLGMRITKELSKEARDYVTPSPAFTMNKQVVDGHILYDVAAIENGKTVVAAWDLSAQDSQSAYLGHSEVAATNNNRVSVSKENKRIFVSSAGQKLAVFAMESPPRLIGEWDLSPFIQHPDAQLFHTVSGNWILVQLPVPGGREQPSLVLDASQDEPTCLGQLSNGDFNQNGQLETALYGVGDEIFVYAPGRELADPQVPLQAMTRNEFTLMPCP